MPDIEAQRAAIKKLEFLTGKWAGEARLWHGTGEPVDLIQSEDVQVKLDGLVLLIEGTGRRREDGQAMLLALAIISFDEQTQAYRMRAFNDGNYLETEVTLAADGQGLNWGFELGNLKTASQLRINERGEWTEIAEIVIGPQPPMKLLELTVRRQS